MREYHFSLQIETMENDWNLVEESDLGDMVNIQNQLFGLMDLIKKVGLLKTFSGFQNLMCL